MSHPKRKISHISLPESPDLDLTVVGRACCVIDDPSAALLHHQERHLMPWMGKRDVMISRFDARAWLEEPSQFAKLKRFREQWKALELKNAAEYKLLEQERYQDLEEPADEEQAVPPEEEETVNEEPQGVSDASEKEAEQTPQASEPTAQAVIAPVSSETAAVVPPGMALASTTQVQGILAPDPAEASGFVPSFAVPSDMNLPSSLAQHLVIQRTVDFVAKNIQAEVLLKVQQAKNEKLAFLFPGHALNDYYEYLKTTGFLHVETPVSQSVPVVPVATAIPPLEAPLPVVTKPEEVVPPVEESVIVQITQSAKPVVVEEAEQEVEEPPPIPIPPEVRIVVSRLVPFVVRRGTVFEELVKAQEEGNTLFRFLQVDGEYHEFYLQSLDAFRRNLPQPAFATKRVSGSTSSDDSSKSRKRKTSH
eukprot:gb/GEZN01007496.1/.p1 GENE.gb/GEZN01007496.1/~~gb/GEZN01007496.1/.p1  ORF type:complete len:421 (-),score=75.90 gb/GEZN01007496.1/:184-1446(-)